MAFVAPQEADWHRMISEAAYYLAEKRNFAPGHALQDWLAAEAMVKQLISPDEGMPPPAPKRTGEV